MARLLLVEDNHDLAALMLAAAKSRGHGVHVVHTGEDALAALAPDVFDAAIVDLLLPDIRGGEVLLALRAMGVPAIAMSGVYKGDRFAREATQVHGALAFFEKPFELTNLLEALERLCRLPPTRAVQRVEEEDAHDLEELEPLTDEEISLPPLDFSDEEDAPAGSVEQPVQLPFENRDQVWLEQELTPSGRVSVPTWSLAGELANTSVARLINAYYHARHDGELKLSQGAVTKVLTFETGCIVGAVSNLAHERFGRFCIRRRVLAEEDYPSVSQLATEAKIPTGEAMIRLGILAPDRRKALLKDQAKEIIWSVLGWEQGSYAFQPPRKKRADRTSFSLFPGDVIIEGVLTTVPLVALREEVPRQARLYPTSDAAYALYELKLSGAQAQLLAHTDGSKTVEDLITLSDLSEREALAALRAFELLGLLEERAEEPRSRRITYGL